MRVLTYGKKTEQDDMADLAEPALIAIGMIAIFIALFLSEVLAAESILWTLGIIHMLLKVANSPIFDTNPTKARAAGLIILFLFSYLLFIRNVSVNIPQSIPSPQNIGDPPCFFLHGKGTDTICLINPEEDFRDSLYNMDSCKGCGINEDLDSET